MLVDKQSELMSDLLFSIHQHGGDDVTWKPPISKKKELISMYPGALVSGFVNISVFFNKLVNNF